MNNAWFFPLVSEAYIISSATRLWLFCDRKISFNNGNTELLVFLQPKEMFYFVTVAAEKLKLYGIQNIRAKLGVCMELQLICCLKITMAEFWELIFSVFCASLALHLLEHFHVSKTAVACRLNCWHNGKKIYRQLEWHCWT